MANAPVATSGSRWDIALAAALIIAASALAFYDVAQILFEQWMTNDTYSFGILVPVISLYAVWMQRERLHHLPIEPSPWIGISLIGACAALLVLGKVIGVVGVQEIAMVLMVPSTVWLLLGRRHLRALWFPIGYLFLMLPIWEILTDRFHYRFQLFSASLGQFLLGVAGIPVHRNETYLELPNITLEVASACSGVNFLIAVIAIGVPQAYLFLAGAWPRAIVIGFALAVAMFSNGLRIALIGVLSHYELSATSHGPGHILQGLFASTAGIIALQIALALMARKYPKPPRPGNPRERNGYRMPRWQVLSAVSLSVLALVVAANAQPRELLASTIDRAHEPLPMEPAWPGLGTQLSTQFVSGGDAPNLGRSFKLTPLETVWLYTGNFVYIESGGSLRYRLVDLPTHAPVSETPVPTADGMMFVNGINFRDGANQVEVLYWYEVNGTAVSQITSAKLRAVWGVFSGAPLPQLVVLSRTRPLGSNASVPMSTLANQVLDVLRFRTRT
jgi:exosortase